MKTFHSIEELKPYYNDKTCTYEFVKDGVKMDVEFMFDLHVDSNIIAQNIDARDINAGNIHAGNIDAMNINARDIHAGGINASVINAGDINAITIIALNIDADVISYYAVCFAYRNIVCSFIDGRRENSKHFVLDGEIIIKPKELEKQK